MKAIFLKDKGLLEVEELAVPMPKQGEVRIQVDLAGICGSDSSMYTGKLAAPMPVIPGHEAIGRIDMLGEGVASFQAGQRVTIHPNYFCGECPPCQKGLTNICHEKIRLGVDINGVFAEYVVVPARAVYPVDDDLPDDVAVFAEPLSVAMHGLRQATPQKQERVLVLGAGVIGQLTLQLAALQSDHVAVCDLVESRLQLAMQMGAAEVLCGDEAMQAAESSYDLIYETSGAPAGLAMAIQLAAPGGRIVLLGLPGQEYPVSTVQIVRKELKICGSMIYTDEFSESLELLAQKKIQTAPLVSERIPLEELQVALDNFSAPQRMKSLVRISLEQDC